MHQTTCVFLPSPRFFALGDGHSDLGRTRRNAITPHFTQRSFLRCPRLSRRLGTPKEDARHRRRDAESSSDNTSFTHMFTTTLSPRARYPTPSIIFNTTSSRSIDHPPSMPNPFHGLSVLSHHPPPSPHPMPSFQSSPRPVDAAPMIVVAAVLTH